MMLKPKKTVDLVCMQAAVEKRENALIEVLDVFASSVKSALQSRRDGLKAAWAISDKKDRAVTIRKACHDQSPADFESQTLDTQL